MRQALKFVTFGYLALFFVVPVQAGSLPTPNLYDFHKLYPSGLQFEIRRDGEPIGFHSTTLQNHKGRLHLKTDVEMNTKILFGLLPYNFRYRSSFLGSREKLLAFESETAQNGEKSSIKIKAEGPKVTLQSEKKKLHLEGDLKPTPHWMSVKLGDGKLVDGTDGTIVSLDVQFDGREAVPTKAGSMIANRFTLTGPDYETVEWYDDVGRWVGMRFEAPDGSLIEYHCIQCGMSDKRFSATSQNTEIAHESRTTDAG